MSIVHTKEERAEKCRLEAIASNAMLSEAERELARERIQRIRDAAVARAKLREIQGRDITEPADEPEPAAPPVTRDEGESDTAYEYRLALYRLDLDLRAAGEVLNDPNASLAKRQSAKATIRKAHKEREALNPPTPVLPGIALAPDAPAPVVETEYRPFRYADYHPFTTSLKPGTAGYNAALKAWESSRDQLERWAYLGRLEKEDLEALAKELARYQKPKDNSCYPDLKQRESDTPFVASPLQKQVWKEQSEEFARQRGESVDSPKPAPIPEPPEFIY